MNKTRMALLLTSVALACVASASEIGDVLSTLPEADHLFGKNFLEDFQPLVKQDDAIKTEIVDAEGMPFEKALEIETLTTPKYHSDISLTASVPSPITKGDVLLLTLYMECLKTQNDIGQGIVQVEVRRNSGERLIMAEFTTGKEWKQCYVRGVAVADCSAGTAQLRITLGFRPQTIRIGGLDMLNFGHGIEVERLPVMPLTYEGVAPDAPWRAAAAQRIEKYRKSDITVQVTDASGVPVEGADVSATLTRHAFGFGGPYVARLHVDERFRDELPAYQRHFKQCFNKAVLPNALKWKQYAEKGTTWAPLAYEWLSENEIPVRGHNMIWPGWNFLPAWLREYENDPAKLRSLTRERVETVMKEWRGKLVEWDVTNEVWRQHALMDICGEELFLDWYRWMRELDPDTKLYYNDANTLVNNQPGHQDHYFETIKWMLEEHVPVDGMGFESHVHQFVPPETIYKRIDRFAQLGPDIQITEFDIAHPAASDEFIAQYARDFMTIVFSHPKPIGIVTWLGGNPLRRIDWGHKSHRPQAAFFDENWNLTPLGKVWLDLKTKEWSTNENGLTDSDGVYRTRGFHGEYEITAAKQGKTAKIKTTLGKEAATVSIGL